MTTRCSEHRCKSEPVSIFGNGNRHSFQPTYLHENPIKVQGPPLDVLELMKLAVNG